MLTYHGNEHEKLMATASPETDMFVRLDIPGKGNAIPSASKRQTLSVVVSLMPAPLNGSPEACT